MIPQSGLTGKQVFEFRQHLGESQAVFARRVAVSQPAIFRLERRAEEIIDTTETRLIRHIAAEEGYSFEDNQ